MTDFTNEFESEHKMLQELAKFPHAHIVPHLASWTKARGSFCILYPLAQCSLKVFMEVTPTPVLTKEVVLWFLYQLKGLADAVRNIHFLGGPSFDTTGRHRGDITMEQRTAFHHDIKPANILLFLPEDDNKREAKNGAKAFQWDGLLDYTPSTLQISDFGASKFGNVENNESSHVPKAKGTHTYEGPDIHTTSRASRPYDIWALGCVFLEFTSWLFLPYEEAVQIFAKNRTEQSQTSQDDDQFWIKVSTPRRTHLDTKQVGEAKIRDAVEARLNQLEEHHCNERRAFKDVLKVIRAMLKIDIEKRLNADTLLGCLDPIVKQAESDLKVFPDMYKHPSSPSQSPRPNPKKIAFAFDNSSLGSASRKKSSEELREPAPSTTSPIPIRFKDSVTSLGTEPQLQRNKALVDEEQDEDLLYGPRGRQGTDPPIGTMSAEAVIEQLSSPDLADLSKPQLPKAEA